MTARDSLIPWATLALKMPQWEDAHAAIAAGIDAERRRAAAARRRADRAGIVGGLSSERESAQRARRWALILREIELLEPES